MCCKYCCFLSLYLVKSIGICSWILRSLFLLHQNQNLNTLWNITTSLLVLILDVFLHFSYIFRECCPILHKIFLGLFFIGIGPVLLILSLVGSVSDSINYDDLFCTDGCSASIVFRDLHLALLFILSIFGLAAGLIYVYIEINFTSNSDLKIPLISELTVGKVYGEEETCSICREKMSMGEEVVKISLCRHMHHKECFGKWLNVKKECPICRLRILIC